MARWQGEQNVALRTAAAQLGPSIESYGANGTIFTIPSSVFNLPFAFASIQERPTGRHSLGPFHFLFNAPLRSLKCV